MQVNAINPQVNGPVTAPPRLAMHIATPSGTCAYYLLSPVSLQCCVDVCLSSVLQRNSSKLHKVTAAAMANVGGANVLANLKQRMQTLRDELDRCKDNYDDKCRELEAERELRNEVRVSAL